MSDPHVNDHHHDYDHDDDQEDLARRMRERQNRPASIDMALNLERELDDDHEHSFEHEHGDGDEHGRHPSTSIEASLSSGQALADMNSSLPNSNNGNRRVSLDPNVLQHIITNLRSELTRAQSERDALAEALAGAPTRERELREALDLLTEKSARNEEELEQLRRKSQDDEDAIQMLRTKLEESRRALMRLQTESKRMSHASHMSVDISRANSLFGGAPPSSKRASFTPLTGSGISASQRANNHRRISSISEPSIASDGTDPPSPTGTVAGQTVSWPGDADAKKARRSSAFFGGMPVNMHMSLARSTTPSPPTQQRQLVPENGFNSEELEALKKERDSARAELATAKKELAEAQEAREASEQCVVALRSFISAQTEAGNDVGGSSISGILKLPPLPTEKNVDESIASNKRAAKPTVGAGWSFGKLFRADSNVPTSDGSSSANKQPPTASSNSPDTPTTVRSPGSGNSSHSPSPSTATPSGAFSRTFGGFFSARAPSVTSIGSVSSNSNPGANTAAVKVKPPLPPRPPTAHGQQEPTLNGLGSDEEDANDADAEDSIDSTGPVSPHDENDKERTSRVSEIWIRNPESVSSGAASEVGVAVNGTERISLDSVRENGKGTERERESVRLGGATAA